MSSLLSEVTKPGSAHETPAMMHRFDSRSSAIALAMASSLPNTTSGSTPLMSASTHSCLSMSWLMSKAMHP